MIEQRIRARVGAYSVPAVVHAVQGDTGRVFVFELEDYTITGAEGASLNCQRPDGSFYTYSGTVDADTNTVTVALDVDGGALSQEGVVTFQLELTEGGLIVCSFRGSTIVEPVVGGEATTEELDFRDAIQAQLNSKASMAQVSDVKTELQGDIGDVAEDLAQEILDRTSADATKANKSTTINGKDLSEDRVIYAQDVPSKNLLPNNWANMGTVSGITMSANEDGSITISGTATANISVKINQLSGFSLGSFIASGASGGSSSTYHLQINKQASSGGEAYTSARYTTGDTELDLTSNFNGVLLVYLTIYSGYSFSAPVTIYPMIRLASIEDDSYVPYAKTNVELSQGGSGSNYTKLPDGTQICWGTFNTTGGSATAWGTMYINSFTVNVDFPVAFVAPPALSVICNSDSSGVVNNAQYTAERITKVVSVRQTATDYQKSFVYMAIGRWK